MVLKKVDERIRTLIENGVKARHRSMFVIVGDKSRDQIVNLHYMLSKSVVKSRPKVLWCYKKELGLELSSHPRKLEEQLKKLIQSGRLDPEKADSLSHFVKDATHRSYEDSEKILGNTYGMCILQDFEALTPNLLARTIETVEGGGLIILLLRSLFSLTSLYTMVMDVHARFRTESHSQVSGRFNERLLLSIASCKACIVMDDETNILPISSHVKTIAPAPLEKDSEGLSESERELKNLKERYNGVSPDGPVMRKCCTVDQAKAVVTFLDAISEKKIQRTIALRASRGRGKSAALGLAIAGAVDAGYSNIFVTAPSLENLKTLFEFVCKGFDMLRYKEGQEYDVVKSKTLDFNEATVKINISKHHRQSIQYIQPHEHEKLSQVDLLVIDEAAAIPLPIVKSLLGPYLVFLSSTVHGYEGTGRSLSFKLLHQLKEQSHSGVGRPFEEIELNESIRYASADPIEAWLNSLLCLDATNYVPSVSLHDPEICDLYYVNRDTLFSYHRDSELFLQRMMALYVASHYKNSPNDLQLMADAPAHHLFVLLGPVDESKNRLPDILCVIQICFEGKISQKAVVKSLTAGHLPAGDQIPWKFCEQFRDTNFASLSGARIVRIATHPSAMRRGYGSRAVKLLARYFENKFAPFNELAFEEVPDNTQVNVVEAAEKASLLQENIKPRTDLPPLLTPLHDRRPEKLHYLGVSFGLTSDLFRFWRKNNFLPFYIGHAPNKVTGEHTCMVLRPLNIDDINSSGSDRLSILSRFHQVFRRNHFIEDLNGDLRQMEIKLAMSILDPKCVFPDVDPTLSNSNVSLSSFSKYLPDSMKHLEAYTKNLAGYHSIKNIVRDLATAYLLEEIPVTLSHVQVCVLLCMGLQKKDIPCIAKEMHLENNQVLDLYMKVMKEFYKYLSSIASKESRPSASRLRDFPMEPLSVPLEELLNNAAKQVQDKMQTTTRELLNSDPPLYASVAREVEVEKTRGGEPLSDRVTKKKKRRKV